MHRWWSGPLPEICFRFAPANCRPSLKGRVVSEYVAPLRLLRSRALGRFDSHRQVPGGSLLQEQRYRRAHGVHRPHRAGDAAFHCGVQGRRHLDPGHGHRGDDGQGVLYMGAMLFYLRAIQQEEASVVAPFFRSPPSSPSSSPGSSCTSASAGCASAAAYWWWRARCCSQSTARCDTRHQAAAGGADGGRAW